MINSTIISLIAKMENGENYFRWENLHDHVTLKADGKSLKVHRLILCACSKYFEVGELFDCGAYDERNFQL